MILSNGVDLSRFGPVTNLATARRAAGFDAGGPLVGFSSRLIPEKGLRRLLEAVSRLRHRFPSLHLLVLGSGPEAELASRDPHVTLLGFRPDPERVIPLLDVFAFPSTYSEGTPNALLEAMACGVPSVAHDLPQVRAIVDPGRNAVLCDTTDAVAFASEIERLLSNPDARTAMGTRARDWIAERHSLDRMIHQAQALYESERL